VIGQIKSSSPSLSGLFSGTGFSSRSSFVSTSGAPGSKISSSDSPSISAKSKELRLDTERDTGESSFPSGGTPSGQVSFLDRDIIHLKVGF
jgi:hypothetical protein